MNSYVIGYLTPDPFSAHHTATVEAHNLAQAAATFALMHPAVKVISAYYGERAEDINRLTALLDRVKFRGWKFAIEAEGDGLYLVTSFYAQCAATGEALQQRSRKWRLSQYMTDGEVVQTALLSVLTANEHEVREAFSWDGLQVFGPHFDLQALAQLCRAGATQHRADLEVAA